MQDRVPTPGKENRVRIRTDDGQTIEGVFEYADEASVQGSVYNKANVLPDDVCTSLGIPTSAEPKDAYDKISNLIKGLRTDINEKYVFGTYSGGSAGTNSINLGFSPFFVFVYKCGGTSWEQDAVHLGFCSRSNPLVDYSGGAINALEITSLGFKVSGVFNHYALNKSGTYAYIAVKEML